MTRRATATSSRTTPTRPPLALAPDFSEPATRAWGAPREVIKLPCGRVVLRELVDGAHRYQLWEPADVAAYSVTRTVGGKLWGLARTRRFEGELPASPTGRHGALVEHEMTCARKAVEHMRATVPELRLREADGERTRPAGFRSGIYESAGDLVVYGRPHDMAERALRGGI